MEQMNNEQMIYHATLYCRLSKDDEQAGESVSIGTQKMILKKYCEEHGFSIFGVYVDDGYSGLNFDRPEFQQMLKDVEDGKINLVITKDLSRLGRDYIQTGYYAEVYFAQKRVRYIAVNDGIDTNHDNNDIAPFKNILNDMYAKDLSRKVKNAKRQYGYKVDSLDKNHLIADDVNVALATPMSLVDKNLYAYCDNNPVARIDVSGKFWETVFDVISLGSSVVEVAVNPADPWAWASLVGDTIDLISFITGDAVKSARCIYNTSSATNGIRKYTGSYEIKYMCKYGGKLW